MDYTDRYLLEMTNEEVIDIVIDSYGEELKRLIFTYVKNYAQTDDIFQEVLIKVYQNFDTFQGNSSLKTWLYRITINKCKDYLRSPFHKIISHYQEEVGTYHNVPSAEQQAISNEQEKIVVNAILTLPVKYREIFVMKFYQSFSIKQISEALNINESTVKSRIMRGKKKVQKKIGGDILEQYE
ncbi:RNA polymerase sigma factor [Aquisalibacillus elongatus]|nr:sigma-70 family RNA polymerase sigma factor [Aquisalibacillus elongatus]